ncbi:NADPH dehydrogenase [Verticillium alfalfae VaMs.102]|uniref:NADPH dehydrogenase n=1 Tax=Verticillium alfalfae (strain VaMs.102 / ATCC MYA-4576 / FGSC 10136) TaxID=526221 RepID=C9SLY4_VERA1|nr:NADPH dehydrogenase [Verticillium alfalfae VaMs.102]EEY19799.1 NADPH dehydrogenase [Verticillium alfalfae VaMs.102]
MPVNQPAKGVPFYTPAQEPAPAPSPPASTSSRSTPPTATSSPSSSRPCPTRGRTATAARLRTARASSSRFSAPSALSSPTALPLFVRISGTEWMEHAGRPSWDLDESIRLAKLLPGLGVDLLDVSSGGNSADQKIDIHPYYQVSLAERIRAALEETARRCSSAPSA